MNLNKCAAFLAVGSLLISGCSSAVKDNGQCVVASLDGHNIYADDVYNYLYDTEDGKNAIFTVTYQALLEKYFPETKSMDETADDYVEQFESYVTSNYGEDNIETVLNYYYGCSSLEEYRSQTIKSLQESELLNEYVNNNFDKVFNDYYKNQSPRKVSLVYVSVTDVDNPTDDEKTKLKEVKKLVKTSKDFGDIATDYSDDTGTNSKKGSLGVVDKADTSYVANSYADEVYNAAMELKEGEISDPIKTDGGYYWLKCTDTSKKGIKAAVKDLGIDSPLIAYDQYMLYDAIEAYNLQYGNDEVKKVMEDYISSALAQRSSGGDE